MLCADALAGSCAADVVTGYFDVIQGQHLLDFWLNVCICHSLIVEQPKNGGLPTFQASQQHTTGVPCPATRGVVPMPALQMGLPHLSELAGVTGQILM